jgi:hypothetical protein
VNWPFSQKSSSGRSGFSTVADAGIACATARPMSARVSAEPSATPPTEASARSTECPSLLKARFGWRNGRCGAIVVSLARSRKETCHDIYVGVERRDAVVQAGAVGCALYLLGRAG